MTMKIETVPAFPASNAEGTSDAAAGDGVLMLRISGTVDSGNAVVQRARELVQGINSPRMLRSFEAAVSSSAFRVDE